MKGHNIIIRVDISIRRPKIEKKNCHRWFRKMRLWQHEHELLTNLLLLSLLLAMRARISRLQSVLSRYGFCFILCANHSQSVPIC